MAAVTIWKQLTGSLLPHYTPPTWFRIGGGGAEVATVWVVRLSQHSPAHPSMDFVHEIPALPGRHHEIGHRLPQLGPGV